MANQDDKPIRISIESKFLEKLIDTAATAVGAVAGPWVRRRQARAIADETRILTQAAVDAKAIAEGKVTLEDADSAKELKLIPLESSDDDDIRTRAVARISYQETSRQRNIESITKKASCESVDDVSDDPVNPDWTARFFEVAQDVSDEQMQDLWGKILAGEVAQPGSYSIRTLDRLRNLTRDEANLFALSAKYALHGRTIATEDNDLLDNRGLAAKIILILEDCGLLSAPPFLKWTLTTNSSDHFVHDLVYGDRVARLEHENPSKEIGFSCIVFTPVGQELLRLVHVADYDYEYFDNLIKKLIGQGVKASLGEVSGRDSQGRATAFKIVG